jgi:hypothetical protein
MGTGDSRAWASHGGTSQAEVHTSARSGKQRAAPVARQESTRASRWSSWVRRRHRTVVGGPSQRPGEAVIVEAPGGARDKEWSGAGFGELSPCNSSKAARAATLRGARRGHTGDLKCGGERCCSGHAEEQRGMEQGNEEEKEELASPGSGVGDKDNIFSARGGGRGPAAAVAGDQRGEAVTGPWQRGHVCARSDQGVRFSGRCN